MTHECCSKLEEENERLAKGNDWIKNARDNLARHLAHACIVITAVSETHTCELKERGKGECMVCEALDSYYRERAK